MLSAVREWYEWHKDSRILIAVLVTTSSAALFLLTCLFSFVHDGHFFPNAEDWMILIIPAIVVVVINLIVWVWALLSYLFLH